MTTGFAAATVGDQVSFSKTVGESDVYLFAGITGDLSPNHVNAQAMAATSYGQRIAHGVLTVGFMSTSSTKMMDKLGGAAVSYGYDRVRFVAPVFIGDTLTVDYEITEKFHDLARIHAAVVARNQNGTVVAAAQHIMQFI